MGAGERACAFARRDVAAHRGLGLLLAIATRRWPDAEDPWRAA